MRFCWFAQTAGPLADADLAHVETILTHVPGAAEALLFTPGATNDPYLNDGHPPSLALQIYFDTIQALETALSIGGALMALASVASLARAAQQAMLVRQFPIAGAPFRETDGMRPCSYLVAYEGVADDLPVWLSHYLDHHAPIMTRFPGVRRVEVCTRLDWCGALPWRRVDHMQRNKIVFDDEAALTAALNSPVRHEMRADFTKFPPFRGPVTHFPMTTRTVQGAPRRRSDA